MYLTVGKLAFDFLEGYRYQDNDKLLIDNSNYYMMAPVSIKYL